MKAGENIAAIILAAGLSTRMGSFKPLLPLAGSTVIENSVSTFKEAGVRDIYVVVGHRANELKAVLKDTGVQIVFNSAYTTGMFSSVQAGVNSLKASTQAFFFLPGDIPIVQPSTIARLLEVYPSNPAAILYPCLKGERGHPPLIPANFKTSILAWQGDGGLRALLEMYEAQAKDIEVYDQGVLLDMDTPVDYQKICESLSVNSVPSEKECLIILENEKVATHVVQHCKTVARVAKKIAVALNNAGYQLDTDLILAAALLHDIARGKKEHARVGSQMLSERGYLRVAEIVAEHMDIHLSNEKIINETSVVYLADKLVKEDQLVSLTQRYNDSLNRYASEATVLPKITQRFGQAERIKQELEKVLKLPLESII